jgi:hypothetical protein
VKPKTQKSEKNPIEVRPGIRAQDLGIFMAAYKVTRGAGSEHRQDFITLLGKLQRSGKLEEPIEVSRRTIGAWFTGILLAWEDPAVLDPQLGALRHVATWLGIWSWIEEKLPKIDVPEDPLDQPDTRPLDPGAIQ